MPAELVAALGILEVERRVLMVANWRNLGGGEVLCWDVPGGGVERGESLEAACRREVKEETGLDVVVNDLAFVVERFRPTRDGGVDCARFFFFTVAGKDVDSARSPAPIDPEILDAEFVSPADLAARCPHSYQQPFLRWLHEGRRQRYFHLVTPGTNGPGAPA